MHRDRLCRFMAFDRHMNLVLGDAEEYRKLPPKKGIPDDEVWRMCGRSWVLLAGPVRECTCRLLDDRTNKTIHCRKSCRAR